MRTKEEVTHVQRLIRDGMNDCAIHRVTGIPRSTVRDWRHGKTPGRRRRRRRPTGGSETETCSVCGHDAHVFHQLPIPEYTYLLGMYLGDGCISKATKGVMRLRIFLDTKYPGIIDECVRAMGTVMPTSKVDIRRTHPGVNCAQISSFSKAWPCLFPQHGSGMKHQRDIALVQWQQDLVDLDPQPLVRGLIHSDGCRVINKSMGYEYLRYMFGNESAGIRRIFCAACDQLGIPWRQPRRNNISIARREGVEMLDSFIGPKS